MQITPVLFIFKYLQKKLQRKKENCICISLIMRLGQVAGSARSLGGQAVVTQVSPHGELQGPPQALESTVSDGRGIIFSICVSVIRYCRKIYHTNYSHKSRNLIKHFEASFRRMQNSLKHHFPPKLRQQSLGKNLCNIQASTALKNISKVI